jgi:CBS domain-containing protein
MLEAKDIMTKNVVCIKKEIPVLDAIKLMSENNIIGIPVVENDMIRVGILSEQDVLRLFHTYEDEKDRIVNGFMTKSAVRFEEDEPLLLFEGQQYQKSPGYVKWQSCRRYQQVRYP